MTFATGGVVGTAIQNAGRKDTYGIEAETELAVTDHLRLGATFGYTKVNFKVIEFFDTATNMTVNIADAYHPDSVPKFTYSIFGGYDQPLSFGNLSASLNWKWKSATFPNSQFIKGPEDFPADLNGIPGFVPGVSEIYQRQKSYGLLGGQIKLTINSANMI